MRYYRHLLGQAKDDTIQFVREHVMIEAMFGIASAVAAIYLAPGELSPLKAVLSIAAGCTVTVVANYIFNLLRIPPKWDETTNAELIDLRSQVSVLENPPKGIVELFDLSKRSLSWHIFARLLPDPNYPSVEPKDVEECVALIWLSGGDLSPQVKLSPNVYSIYGSGYNQQPFNLGINRTPADIHLTNNFNNESKNQPMVASQQKVANGMTYDARLEIHSGLLLLARKHMTITVDSQGIVRITDS